jgi:hypothetical protein
LPDDFDTHSASQADLTRYSLFSRELNASHPLEVHNVYSSIFPRQWLVKDRIIPNLEPNIGKPICKDETSWVTHNWAGTGQNMKTHTDVVGT